MAEADAAPEGAKLGKDLPTVTELPEKAAEEPAEAPAEAPAEEAAAGDERVAVPEEGEESRVEQSPGAGCCSASPRVYWPSSEPEFVALEVALKEARQKNPLLKFEEARELIVEALEAGRAKQPGRPHLRSLCCNIGLVLLAVVVLLTLLLFTRALFTEVVARDGLLLGAASYRDQEPLAAVAVARESRSLATVAALSPSVLRNVRDVALVHEGTWRCLHISSVTKYSDWHVWLQAADGSGLRVRGGKALLRVGFLGDEEELRPSEDFIVDVKVDTNSSNTSAASVVETAVVPTAYFDVLLST